MSIRITLVCDQAHGFSSCAQTLVTDALSVDEARGIGDANGWRYSGGRDYCPSDSRTRVRPRVVLVHEDGLRVSGLRPDELLMSAEDMLLALVNSATAGRWTHRPANAGVVVSDGKTIGSELVRGGHRGTDFVARTGPARHPQGAADAAYIAAVDPDVGRAVTAVLHEAFESVHQDGGIVQGSLHQAAVDLAAALTQPRNPEESP